MPPVTGTSSINLTSISNDTLTESFFAGTAQGMVDQKKLAGSRLNTGLRDMSGKRDKRIRELNKYVKELTKGGFFRMFLKIFSFVMKILNPLDTILGKVFKGKLKWLQMALSFAVQAAQIFFTGGASVLQTVTQQLTKKVSETVMKMFQKMAQMMGKSLVKPVTKMMGKSLVKTLTKQVIKNASETVLKIVRLAVTMLKDLSQVGISIMDMAKQKSMALHQKEAERFQTLAMQAGKTVESNSDEIRRIQEGMTKLISRTSETINIEEQGREALTKL
ncbi:MAG: hypothetical protein HY541_05915 [Deltaproteobacteria bacterium]|nr:hypothetical protein [Deltaproteobacteria bacterium]